jgi:pimeloyl-ACP methyl ester carboxylesterase
MVMWDGNIDEGEPRPYNVGYHEDVKYQVQMTDYFLELVNHIDSHYRTLTGRNHRGIIGFSMGGFMSFFLAGKYPDSIGAAVSIAGSPEFFVGSPDNHSLYPVRFMFKNLQGVNIRMHNGDSDILYFLNQEVHQGALWQGIPLEYWQFHGGHMVDKPGETKAFEMAMRFVTRTFGRGSPAPAHWTHSDLYPAFDVWGYRVETTKKEPGFISLRNVDRNGFGIDALRWLPGGPPIQNIRGRVTTPPVYEPRRSYRTVKYERTSGETSMNEAVSDSGGRLTLEFDSGGMELGLYREQDPPDWVVLDYQVGEKRRRLGMNTTNALTIRLFNRGGEGGMPETIQAAFRTTDPAVTIAERSVSTQANPGQRVVTLPPLRVSCTKRPPPHAEPADVRFSLEIRAGGRTWEDELTVPVDFSVPYFTATRIDDGVAVRDTVLGLGNADGVADAGERIMVYEGTHRLRLYADDPWIIGADERLADEIIPARWPDGYTLSSVIHVSPDCPDGHQLDCLACYETKAFNPIERKVTWGHLRITVRHR